MTYSKRLDFLETIQNYRLIPFRSVLYVLIIFYLFLINFRILKKQLIGYEEYLLYFFK